MPQLIDRKKRSSINTLNPRQKSKSATQLIKQTSTINLNPGQWLLPETEEYLRTNNKKAASIVTTENDDASQQDEPTQSRQILPTPFREVKAYLKKNSLVSKGLTIFDVLQPVSITVKEPHHIHVIDRYVLAKVWDDILPLTYGSYANKFRLVNHYAVNLEEYEAKLRKLITEYHQFTARFIWKCLNDDNKRKLGPHIYWVSLSNEVQSTIAEEITKEENTNQNALEFFAWRKLTTDEQNNLLQKPAVYHEKTAEVLKNALRDAECQSGLQGVTRMDVEIKRAIKFLQISTDLRGLQKRVDSESKQTPSKTPKSSSTSRRIGQRVLCRYDGDGYFYPGIIQKNHLNHSIVLFDMEIEQEILGHVILPFHSNNQLNLFLQDCVLARQMRETEEYWAPGLVLALPSPIALPANLYKIQIYNPHAKQIYVHRKDMIRITLGLFQRSILYLQNTYRKSSGNLQRPVEPPPYDEFEILLRKMLCPLTEQIEYLTKSHHERYMELQTALEDQMGAIRLLRERSYQSQVKFEGTQTEPVSLPTDPPPPITIEPNTHVYAVWFEDDALVYEGTVMGSLGSNKYMVERKDFPGVESIISRDDIFLDSDHCHLKTVDVESFALIKYPKDSRHCYCPAVILRHHQSKSYIRFYDCFDDKHVPNDQDVIPINEKQFERYSEARIEKEISLINQVVVGLNNKTKSFMLGTIETRVGSGHQYKIRWYNDKVTEQKEEHLFGAFTRRDKHRKNAYVLAMDSTDDIYKLAKTISISTDRKRLKVQFHNLDANEGHSSPKIADVPASTSFVITKDYFDSIIEFLGT